MENVINKPKNNADVSSDKDITTSNQEMIATGISVVNLSDGTEIIKTTITTGNASASSNP